MTDCTSENDGEEYTSIVRHDEQHEYVGGSKRDSIECRSNDLLIITRAVRHTSSRHISIREEMKQWRVIRTGKERELERLQGELISMNLRLRPMQRSHDGSTQIGFVDHSLVPYGGRLRGRQP